MINMCIKQEMNIYLTNKATYDNEKVLESMISKDRLQKAEEFIMSYVRKDILNKSILDIGVGTGRTTPYLIEISQDYIGIDYSLEMVKYCKAKYSNIKFLHCDARDMAIFNNQQFDFVFFSFNGIDYVAHEDRIFILKEVYRVLKENGIFAFSSHNIDSKITRAYDTSNILFSINPYTMLGNIYRYLLGITNHLKNKRFEVYSHNYSIINDSGNNYCFLTYYISKEKQFEQLKDIGFSSVEVVSLNGSLVDVYSEDKHPWIYYIARRQTFA
ncbi:MAG: class I SAM-dependent methyltransferase [Candidatus Omnitrophica bacterium]|nr:class I SAM-dependent methyltransferase [Candidatus Poribacteria bacterium]MBM3253834.1 class I SAM-dependent methyltransferase [Candidatus Omnitrophota bacterium]